MAYATQRPEEIHFCECWARDGLQSIATLVSTEHKLEMLRGLIEAGVPEMEVTSFSPPKLLPQFADAIDVLKALPREGHSAKFRVLMPNLRGWERFERCLDEGYGADKIILMISASEAHNLKNFRATHEEAMAEHAAIMKRAHQRGVEVIGCVGTVYGCAILGDIPLAEVDKLVRFYHEEGARLLMLGDTTGQANPVQVERVLQHLFAEFPEVEFLAHFHDTRGTGVANTMTAVNLGIRWVDGSLGAIGGQPASGGALYHLGYKGNTCSEDLVAMFEECGLRTGIDVDRLIELGKRAEEIVGFPMRANIIHAGRVNHHPTPAEKGTGPGLGHSVETTPR
ncbi:MAG: hydroxymethylglutaryl-CoA lyase [Planctomycetota bacterium]|nr:MAG: hydroxymethylglutaryl-CoA lyase [Planctomycetota bacterium]